MKHNIKEKRLEYRKFRISKMSILVGIIAIQVIAIWFLRSVYQNQIFHVKNLEDQCIFLDKQVNSCLVEEQFSKQVKSVSEQLKNRITMQHANFLDRKIVQSEAELAIHLQKYIQHCREKTQLYSIKVANKPDLYYFGLEKYFLNNREWKLGKIAEELYCLDQVVNLCFNSKPVSIEKIKIEKFSETTYQIQLAFAGYTQTLRSFLNELIAIGLPIYIERLTVDKEDIEGTNIRGEVKKNLKRFNLILQYTPSFLQVFERIPS